MKKVNHYHIYLRPEPEGGYTVTVPALPGCVTYGKTVVEAKKMAADAIKAYLASMRKHGETPLTDQDALLATVDVPARA